jgi:hypothetical protein
MISAYQKLIEAMDLVLTDCGVAGNSICRHTKAKATVAFEPFRQTYHLPPHPPAITKDEGRMSLTQATSVLEECEALLAEEDK